MTIKQFISKELNQVMVLAFFLIVQIFALTNLIKYDIMNDVDRLPQGGEESISTNTSIPDRSDSSEQTQELTTDNGSSLQVNYDINGDGVVDESDKDELLSLLSKKDSLSPEEISKCDLDQNGKFETFDISKLKEYLKGKN